MNQQTAIELAKQRAGMLGLSPGEYLIEALAVIGNAQQIQSGLINVEAYNDSYFLTDYEALHGLEIIADSGYFNSDDQGNNTVHEFTGLIQIRQLSGKLWSLQWQIFDHMAGFIHVQRPVNFIRLTILKHGNSNSI